MHRHARKELKSRLTVPDKLFYKIGEVSKITGVESYVLRYWETEFAFLKPRKNRSGQRVYVKKDIELIQMVKRLLYEERYTIEGVKRRFEDGVLRPALTDAPAEIKNEISDPSDNIAFIIKRLRQIFNSIK
jgi:DNA-binding transcriptional MerR regulator